MYWGVTRGVSGVRRMSDMRQVFLSPVFLHVPGQLTTNLPPYMGGL